MSEAETRLDVKQLSASLAYNLKLLGRGLSADGIDTTEVDKIADGAMKFIEDGAKGIEVKHDWQTQNIINAIVMVLMHSVITNQEKYINDFASELGIKREAVISMMEKDTFGKRK